MRRFFFFILVLVASFLIETIAIALPKNTLPGVSKHISDPWNSAAMDSWCRLPKHFRLEDHQKHIAKRKRKMVPISLPPKTETNINACKNAVKQENGCRMSDIVILNAGGNAIPSARCDRDPPGGISYALLNMKTYDDLADQLDILIPDWRSRYQSIVYLSTFRQTEAPNLPVNDTQGCMLAYHVMDYNGVSGIGMKVSPPPEGEVYLSYTDLWSIQDWTIDEFLDPEGFNPLNVLSHESEHDVCCSIKFFDEEKGLESDALIGQQDSHWSFYHNTYGQLMYGGNWRDEGNGTFSTLGGAAGMRPLDLYLWGLLPETQVPPIFIVDTQSATCTPKPQTLTALAKDCADLSIEDNKKCKDDFNLCLEKFDFCVDPPYYRSKKSSCDPYSADTAHSPSDLIAKGRKKIVTMDDILKVQKRTPDWKDSYKVNTFLFVLLTLPDGEFTQANIDTYERFRRAFSRHHYRLTGHRMRVKSTVEGNDDCLLWEWGGDPEWSSETEFEGWKGVGLAKPLSLKKGEKGEIELTMQNENSGITHDNLQIMGSLYDAFQIVMTVPMPSDGIPKQFYGKFVLTGPAGTKDIRFPVLADGKKHTVTVHPPQALLSMAPCKGCLPVCKNVGKPEEGWYESCSGTLLKKGMCKTKDGEILCGPYCSSPQRDLTLSPSDPEGWYDSCVSNLNGLYTTLTVFPVNDPEVKNLKVPILVDRVDIFKVSDERTLDEEKRKDGEKDFDGDGIINAFDNCPMVANTSQIDSNNDGKGDSCGDFDADGIPDAQDNCPTIINSLQQDDNHDGIGNACDPSYEKGCNIGSTSDMTSLTAAFFIIVAILFFRRKQMSR